MLALAAWRASVRRLPGTWARRVRPTTVPPIVVAVSGVAWGAQVDLIADERYYVPRRTDPGAE
ncbi:hypothetical protein OG194_30540 [Streptomyces sp. NBC_01288]|uniref:hypothetical protein n=1 Tax=Streptomyces sp. NBC_01288 TaxID=2903814 RepID=UPI002E0E1C29|nr:hypothetical protein OG194_30540 [Streptomyces sp. NBC_01288]